MCNGGGEPKGCRLRITGRERVSQKGRQGGTASQRGVQGGREVVMVLETVCGVATGVMWQRVEEAEGKDAT